MHSWRPLEPLQSVVKEPNVFIGTKSVKAEAQKKERTGQRCLRAGCKKDISAARDKQWVLISCTNKCSIRYHKPCYRRVSKIEGTRNVICPTPECGGFLSSYAMIELQKDSTHKILHSHSFTVVRDPKSVDSDMAIESVVSQSPAENIESGAPDGVSLAVGNAKESATNQEADVLISRNYADTDADPRIEMTPVLVYKKGHCPGQTKSPKRKKRKHRMQKRNKRGRHIPVEWLISSAPPPTPANDLMPKPSPPDRQGKFDLTAAASSLGFSVQDVKLALRFVRNDEAKAFAYLQRLKSNGVAENPPNPHPCFVREKVIVEEYDALNDVSDDFWGTKSEPSIQGPRGISVGAG
eukprot:TRINITY_DN3888_c0_g2_i1.p1 TRINITY_DN3888_c0_g2~~TRINITY_DN3888_c0_g2_i1.p1  ORF type:complete len:352 (+),score=50.45 TRINITY_DN3888_c0_g2_i1:568-1623(+)